MVHLFLHLSFFVIGAYATTDILRLTVKGTVSVADPVCRCPICNSRIPLRDQIPLISYILRGGKCRFCGSRIPITEPLAEFLIIAGLSLIAVLTGYRPVGFPICLLFYGLCKATALLVIGVR
ncbi:MAG: prepilin peptidase, partial [Lachnospiraceae bacterium]|nr:prepilin peptidase [Lachnospiraceae bacterium]